MSVPTICWHRVDGTCAHGSPFPSALSMDSVLQTCFVKWNCRLERSAGHCFRSILASKSASCWWLCWLLRLSPRFDRGVNGRDANWYMPVRLWLSPPAHSGSFNECFSQEDSHETKNCLELVAQSRCHFDRGRGLSESTGGATAW